VNNFTFTKNLLTIQLGNVPIPQSQKLFTILYYLFSIIYEKEYMMRKIILLLSVTFVALAFFSCDDLYTNAPSSNGELTEAQIRFGTFQYPMRYNETAVGDMVCDAMYWYVNNHKDQFPVLNGNDLSYAFTNGGQFLGGIPIGNVTSSQIDGLLKNDTLAVVKMSGAELLAMFEWFAASPQGAQGYNLWSQVSAQVHYKFDYADDLDNPVRSELTIKGEPIVAANTYYVCTGDFAIRAGGMGGRWLYPAMNANYKADIGKPAGENRVSFVGVYVETAVKQFIDAQAQPYMPQNNGERIVIVGGGRKPYL
jgi:2',3'-cyclic-nucleotide 2'-phosphodiesterase (5'-nucleotidase family)